MDTRNKSEHLKSYNVSKSGLSSQFNSGSPCVTGALPRRRPSLTSPHKTKSHPHHLHQSINRGRHSPVHDSNRLLSSERTASNLHLISPKKKVDSSDMNNNGTSKLTGGKHGKLFHLLRLNTPGMTKMGLTRRESPRIRMESRNDTLTNTTTEGAASRSSLPLSTNHNSTRTPTMSVATDTPSNIAPSWVTNSSPSWSSPSTMRRRQESQPQGSPQLSSNNSLSRLVAENVSDNKNKSSRHQRSRPSSGMSHPLEQPSSYSTTSANHHISKRPTDQSQSSSQPHKSVINFVSSLKSSSGRKLSLSPRAPSQRDRLLTPRSDTNKLIKKNQDKKKKLSSYYLVEPRVYDHLVIRNDKRSEKTDSNAKESSLLTKDVNDGRRSGKPSKKQTAGQKLVRSLSAPKQHHSLLSVMIGNSHGPVHPPSQPAQAGNPSQHPMRGPSSYMAASNTTTLTNGNKNKPLLPKLISVEAIDKPATSVLPPEQRQQSRQHYGQIPPEQQYYRDESLDLLATSPSRQSLVTRISSSNNVSNTFPPRPCTLPLRPMKDNHVQLKNRSLRQDPPPHQQDVESRLSRSQSSTTAGRSESDLGQLQRDDHHKSLSVSHKTTPNAKDSSIHNRAPTDLASPLKVTDGNHVLSETLFHSAPTHQLRYSESSHEVARPSLEGSSVKESHVHIRDQTFYDVIFPNQEKRESDRDRNTPLTQMDTKYNESQKTKHPPQQQNHQPTLDPETSTGATTKESFFDTIETLEVLGFRYEDDDNNIVKNDDKPRGRRILNREEDTCYVTLNDRKESKEQCPSTPEANAVTVDRRQDLITPVAKTLRDESSPFVEVEKSADTRTSTSESSAPFIVGDSQGTPSSIQHRHHHSITKPLEELPSNERAGTLNNPSDQQHSQHDPYSVVDVLSTFLSTKLYKTPQDSSGCLGQLKERSQSLPEDSPSARQMDRNNPSVEGEENSSSSDRGPVLRRNSVTGSTNGLLSVLKTIWGGRRQYENKSGIVVPGHAVRTEKHLEYNTTRRMSTMNDKTIHPPLFLNNDRNSNQTNSSSLETNNHSSTQGSPQTPLTSISPPTSDLSSSTCLMDPQYAIFTDTPQEQSNSFHHSLTTSFNGMSPSQFQSELMMFQQQHANTNILSNQNSASLEPPHPAQFRDFTKVLPRDAQTKDQLIHDLDNASAPENTLIIWDWDDTILPTYHLAVEHRLNITDSYIPEGLKPSLTELESKALTSLQISMQSGCTILVTNASFRWLTDSAEKYFPKLWTFIKMNKVMILSARDVCQPFGLPQPDWKKLLIRDQVERFFEHLDVPREAVADIVAKVKRIQVDDQFISALASNSVDLTQQDGNGHSLPFYIDTNIPEEKRLDRFVRQIAKVYGIHPRVLAMAGLLLSDVISDESHEGSHPNVSSSPNSASASSSPSTQQHNLYCHGRRELSSCLRCIDLLRSRNEAALTHRVRERYFTEATQRLSSLSHRLNNDLNSIDGFSEHSYLISNNNQHPSDPSQASTNAVTFQFNTSAETNDNPTESITVCPYHEHHEPDEELAGIFGAAPSGTKASSYVRLTSGTTIAMKDLFPSPSNELGLAPVPCSVISIGDGLGEREAVLSVMGQYGHNHQAVLQHLRELRDYLHLNVFKRFVDLVTHQHGQHHSNCERGSNGIEMNAARSGVNNDPSTTPIGSFNCKLKAPSAAWSFKSIKLAPHPDIRQLSQTHEKLHAVLELILHIKHSIDATVDEQIVEHPSNTQTTVQQSQSQQQLNKQQQCSRYQQSIHHQSQTSQRRPMSLILQSDQYPSRTPQPTTTKHSQTTSKTFLFPHHASSSSILPTTKILHQQEQLRHHHSQVHQHHLSPYRQSHSIFLANEYGHQHNRVNEHQILSHSYSPIVSTALNN